MTIDAQAESQPAQADSQDVVVLAGITKRFPGVVANSDVHLTVRRAEVHAICGENGAGKSTLMKILYGMQSPDEGTIEVNGAAVRFRSPADAIRAGIGMVHQHFMLADNLTVLENVVLGAEHQHGIGRAARARVGELAKQTGLNVDPGVLVERLGVADRQRVEILKVLYRGAKIVILDEPTAVLVPQEVDELFATLRAMKADGYTFLFISHKLDEVRRIADRITVIRRGTTVGTVEPGQVTSRQLAEMMVGSELPSPETRTSTVTSKEVLRLDGLSLHTADGRPLLDGLDVVVHAGEVLGIAGVEGNGQTELVETIMGMRRASGGRVVLAGQDVTRAGTLARREAGIGYIPEDRTRYGLLLQQPLWANRILGHQTRPPASNGLLLDIPGAKADTARIVEEFDVRTPGIDVAATALSGGNQQKLVVGRELSGEPVLLIASHPTRGVDVGAQAAIWDHIRAARANGLAVLLVSADLDELIGLSDTIKVMLRGRFVAGADPAEVTPEDLGCAMTGIAQVDERGLLVVDRSRDDAVSESSDAVSEFASEPSDAVSEFASEPSDAVSELASEPSNAVSGLASEPSTSEPSKTGSEGAAT
jgi:general nucleoside transport system ATP-binding protein